MINSHYQVGGSLAINAPSYVQRRADLELYQRLKQGEFCYVLNSRQMGKSSLLVKTKQRLETDGFLCAGIDMTSIGSEKITPSQWYGGIASELWLKFKLVKTINFQDWWQQQGDISPLQKLSRFISQILLIHYPKQKFFIFIDEIDSILNLDFSVDDFFALIRSFYNQRAIDSQYNRITFAIFGVATPSDLITDKKRTPFNIGQAIELEGFRLDEVEPLGKGLQFEEINIKILLREILAWTGGQPFLTQKLCQLLSNVSYSQIPSGTEALWVEEVVRMNIIDKWESQDEPEHLRTIRDRILRNKQKAGKLLGFYQQILQEGEPSSILNLMSQRLGEHSEESREQVELLLSGLVIKSQGVWKIKNRIYQEVFNLNWVKQKLESLRPYSQAFTAWRESNCTDTSRLLRGKALKDAQQWSQGKSLSTLDYKFLGASQDWDRHEMQQALEAERAQAIEAQLAQEQQTIKLQRRFFLGITTTLVVALFLGAIAFGQYGRAIASEQEAISSGISEVKVLVSFAEGSFDSNRRLDALIQAIKAQRQLYKLGQVEPYLEQKVQSALRRTIYGVRESNRLSGHSAEVTDVAWFPDGETLASASLDKTIKIWHKDGSLLKTLTGHRAGILGLALSPDGEVLASASEDNTIKLWHRDGSLLGTLTGHQGAITDVAWSPDGEILASASEDNNIKLWHQDGTLWKTLTGHYGTVTEVSWFPDSKTLASASKDGTVKVWMTNGKLLRTLIGHQGEVLSIAIRPDGQTIASASEDRTIKLWMTDGTLLNTLTGHNSAVRSVAWFPEVDTLASASEDNMIKLWHQDGSLLTTFSGHEAPVLDIAISPDGQTIASGSEDYTVRFWKPDSPFLKPLGGHHNPLAQVVINLDEDSLTSLSWDNPAKLWRGNQTPLKPLVNQGQVEIPPNLDTNSIQFRSQEQQLFNTLTRDLTPLRQVAFSPDGKAIASSSSDNSIKLWRKDGTLLHTLVGHNAPITDIIFSPNGELIASTSEDKTVKLWQRQNGSLLKTLTGHRSAVWSVAFSPDGQLIASASLDKTVKLWHRDGTLVTTLTGHGAGVQEIAFSPDGNVMVSASNDQTIILWDLKEILNLDELTFACNWARDYLRTNPEVEEIDRHLCDNLQEQLIR